MKQNNTNYHIGVTLGLLAGVVLTILVTTTVYHFAHDREAHCQKILSKQGWQILYSVYNK